METPREHEALLDELDGVGLVEVYVSESEKRVYDALAHLQGGAEFWCGSQDDLASAADYDKRTVRTASRRLEGRGLVRIWAEPGRPLNYVLTAAPDGRAYVVRSRRGRGGRDVVRGARPVGLAQSQIDGLLASLATAQGGGSEGRITGADRGADPGRIGASVSPAPSLSSSSSSIRPLLPIRPLSPPPPPGAGPGRDLSTPGGDEDPLPEGWESVVEALWAIDVDPEPWLVRELASAPDPWVWQEAIRAAHEHDAETPRYVSACYATALRRWERSPGATASAAAPAGRTPSDVPAADEVVGVEVRVRPMPHPRALSLGEVVVVVAEQAAGSLWRRLRGGGSRGGAR